MLERAVNEGAPFEGERGQVTLDSIGDAVMSTDVTGKITYLNPAAERMTGWSRELAAGRAVEDVYRIIEGTTREALHSPTALAIQEERTVVLTPNCVLIRRAFTATAHPACANNPAANLRRPIESRRKPDCRPPTRVGPAG